MVPTPVHVYPRLSKNVTQDLGRLTPLGRNVVEGIPPPKKGGVRYG